MEIRALREGDDRSQLRSGDLDLDRFFHKFAGQNQFKHYLGVTYVTVEVGRILGFATVAPGHVEIDGLPVSVRKKLTRYPLPVLRLARLAVDQPVRGQGLGRQLLRFVFQLALRMASDYGCVGVVVDAKVRARCRDIPSSGSPRPAAATPAAASSSAGSDHDSGPSSTCPLTSLLRQPGRRLPHRPSRRGGARGFLDFRERTPLAASRQPVNGYRLYVRADLARLLKGLEPRARSSRRGRQNGTAMRGRR
jgi:GNAT superfamily N-acetyltransferase